MLYKCKDTIYFSILHIYTMSFFIITAQQTCLTPRLDWIKAWQSPIPLSCAHSRPRRQPRSPSPASPTPLGSLLPTPNGPAPEGLWACSRGVVSRLIQSCGQARRQCWAGGFLSGHHAFPSASACRSPPSRFHHREGRNPFRRSIHCQLPLPESAFRQHF